MNPVLAPMWVAGIGWCLVARELARLRFLAIAFAAVFLATMVLHGKDYYVAPAYGVAFSLGAIFIERYVRWAIARAIYLVLTGAVAAVGAPYAMPILDPAALAAYMQWLGARPEAQENNQKDSIIPQLHADMLGWRELEAQVAQVWRSLPPDERAKAAIIDEQLRRGRRDQLLRPRRRHSARAERPQPVLAVGTWRVRR
jgi:hypothetical protein